MFWSPHQLPKYEWLEAAAITPMGTAHYALGMSEGTEDKQVGYIIFYSTTPCFQRRA